MMYDKHQTFTVTEDHVRLLRRMYVRWDDTEYGAPCINPKRPYGNSCVPQDIGEILGWSRDPGAEEMSEEAERRARAIHLETETVLQIVLSTGEMKPGVYEVGPYSVNWRPVIKSGED